MSVPVRSGPWYRIEAWSALNMASLTWAFAKLSLRHPKLYAAIASQFAERRDAIFLNIFFSFFFLHFNF